MHKGRASLIASISIGLLAVSTAGVSTYAWFKTAAEVVISPNNSTNDTIRVHRPEGIDVGTASFYEYNENRSSGYTGTIPSDATIDDDFTPLGPNDNVTITPTPGRKMTFAVSVTTTGGATVNYCDLFLKSFVTVEKTNRKVLNNGKTAVEQISSVDKYVRIEQAINMYAHVNSTGVYGTESSSDAFVYDYANPYSNSLSLSLVPSNARMITSSTTAYAFLTIEFSDTSDTWYEEYEYDSSSSSYKKAYTTPSSDSGNRYFWPTTTIGVGNSSCYEGMSFTVTGLEISVGTR